MKNTVKFVDNKIIAGKNALTRKMAGMDRRLQRGDSNLFSTLGLIIIAAVILGLFLTFGKDLFASITTGVEADVMSLFDKATP